jgi:signal transduction histidine kinase/AmiR/NasT family two-component response regulator
MDAPNVAGSQPARVLVVEDEQIVALELKERLSRLGHSVVGVVGSGEEAIERARSLVPDLVLMDIKLQGEMDGIEAAEAIRRAVDLPIVYLTAFADAATVRRAKVTEPYGYIVKPFQERELNVVVEVALYRHRVVRELERLRNRERFLGELSDEVASSLDRETILTRVMRLIVGDLADWCVVHLREGDGFRVVAIRHRDSQKGASYDCGARIPSIDALDLSRAIRDRETRLHSVADEADWANNLLGVKASSASQWAAEAAIVAPLMVRGDVLGTLTVASLGSARSLLSSDCAFVTEIARRLALGLDNAQLYADAQRAIRMRDDVLAIVSHDLKNPLTSVMANADQLLWAPDTITLEHALKNARTIRAAADRMNRLIDDLLDVAQIDGGRLSLELKSTAVAGLVAEAVAMFEVPAARRGVHVESTPVPEREVACDRDRVLQVLSNLIGNAVKFSPDGRSVLVGAEVRDRWLVLSVSDQAGGMTPAQQSHVFERYWQAPEALRKGSGLGLYIARGLIEAHGGRIWLESTFGEGSCFYFTLPLAAPPERWASPVP